MKIKRNINIVCHLYLQLVTHTIRWFQQAMSPNTVCQHLNSFDYYFHQVDEDVLFVVIYNLYKGVQMSVAKSLIKTKK